MSHTLVTSDLDRAMSLDREGRKRAGRERRMKTTDHLFDAWEAVLTQLFRSWKLDVQQGCHCQSRWQVSLRPGGIGRKVLGDAKKI